MPQSSSGNEQQQQQQGLTRFLSRLRVNTSRDPSLSPKSSPRTPKSPGGGLGAASLLFSSPTRLKQPEREPPPIAPPQPPDDPQSSSVSTVDTDVSPCDTRTQLDPSNNSHQDNESAATPTLSNIVSSTPNLTSSSIVLKSESGNDTESLPPHDENNENTQNGDGISPAPPSKSQQDWENKGASTIIKKSTDSSGKVHTKIDKKGVKDFKFGETLGEGSYSTVVQATDRQNLHEYAIKILDKRHILKEKKVKYVNIEKNTLNRLGNHPGIVKLYYTFQDDHSLYFVLDLATNGELLGLIKRMGSLNEECTAYFGSQLLDTIEYMHKRGVMHRDLKPENILLDSSMHIKITDFGTAKLVDVPENGELSETEEVRANSFVGTAEYVSPELLRDKSACMASDIWAFGCVLYQMIAGRPPFKASNEYQIFQKIMKLEYYYPPGFPRILSDLVRRILVLDPAKRPSIAEIKNHKFFQGIDWSRQAIWSRKAPKMAPYTHKLGSNVIHPPSSGLQSSQRNSLAAAAAKKANANVTSSGAAAAVAMAKASQIISQASNNTSSQHTQRQQQQQQHVFSQSQPSVNTYIIRPAMSHRGSRATLRTASDQSLPTSNGTRSLSRKQQPRTPSSPAISVNSPSTDVSRTSTRVLVSSPLRPTRTASNGQETAESEPKNQVTELAPPTQIDIEWSWIFTSSNERIVKVGLVSVTSHPRTKRRPSQLEATLELKQHEDDQVHNPKRFSRIFQTSRYKKRFAVLTNFGRFLIVSTGATKRIKESIQLTCPSVGVRELPFSKRSKSGAFLIDSQDRVFTIDDPAGTAEWMRSIRKAESLGPQLEVSCRNNNHHGHDDDNDDDDGDDGDGSENGKESSHRAALMPAAQISGNEGEQKEGSDDSNEDGTIKEKGDQNSTSTSNGVSKSASPSTSSFPKETSTTTTTSSSSGRGNERLSFFGGRSNGAKKGKKQSKLGLSAAF